MSPEKLDALAAELSRIDESADYYALTLTVTEDGRLHTATQTGFAGPGSKPMWEMRCASLVHPHHMRSLWRDMGQRSVVVNSNQTMALYMLRIGGNAVVEASVFSKWFGHLLEPKECVPSRLGEGVRTLDSVQGPQLKHAPSKKMRMDILRRDNFKCRVCGRSPDDNSDIVLHVHHVRPWGTGGLTDQSNLLTLCHTCHVGLDPHLEFRLLDKIPDGVVYPLVAKDQSEFNDAVQRYRDRMSRHMAS